MKTMFSLLLAAGLVLLPIDSFAATIEDLRGTWSGGWTPPGGVRDSVTIEIQAESGKLTGKFRSPLTLDFSNATFNPKTGAVSFSGSDPKSGKLYKIDGKLEGLEIKGSMTQGDQTGELLLIKWTYVPR